MINNATKELILDTARIEEVVGEFVALKKRGSNLLGLCPFHNERTPSFTVSPAKGFFKCFGCGKAGDSVTFIMEHEHLTFPEALRYLANKYNITIEEEAPSPEYAEQQSFRESLFTVTAFAQDFYQDYLWNAEEGKAIGLSYFRERGFTDEIIRRFNLGFAPDKWDALTTAAQAAGYQRELLEKTGLTIVQESKVYDRFRGRVIFPIHSLTGRVIAFGARILKTDPKSPKYLNSPETEIYYKSKNLYGIAQAKKSIIANDACYLVEGYTDVVSLHQAGIENVVASSGTALTVEQIRLIGRYTRNITVLYDGDAAGIKASLRGIDLILEEGMNVRVVLFPDKEDPDSFSRKVSTAELLAFLKEQAVDFITFKTKLLLTDTQGDPIKKAQLIRDIVETIARVPDAIARAAYIRHTSVLMEMQESVLLNELNKILRKQNRKLADEAAAEVPPPESDLPDDPLAAALQQEEAVVVNEFDTLTQEEELVRILLLYADRVFVIPMDEMPSDPKDIPSARVKDFIISQLNDDGIRFSNPAYAAILAAFSTQFEDGLTYNEQEFLQQLDPEIKSAAISVMTSRHELAKWDEHQIEVKRESDQLHKTVIDPVMYIKKKQLARLKNEISLEMKARVDAGLPYDDLLGELNTINQLQMTLNKFTNTVIQK
ncbi:MAG: DNA primase [Bacteroidia bacterium]